LGGIYPLPSQSAVTASLFNSLILLYIDAPVKIGTPYGSYDQWVYPVEAFMLETIKSAHFE
jgi:hypothetical protein